MELVPAKVLRVIGPMGVDRQAAGVIVSTEEKTFLIYVGLAEAHAILRELEGAEVRRPMTHDLMMQALRGFEITLRRVILSSLVDSMYYATILLERVPDEDGGLRQEVMLDARASDSIVLALKAGVTLEVSRQVVDDSTDITQQFAGIGAGIQEAIEELKKATEGEDEEDEEAEGEDDSGPSFLPPQEYDPGQDYEFWPDYDPGREP